MNVNPGIALSRQDDVTASTPLYELEHVVRRVPDPQSDGQRDILNIKALRIPRGRMIAVLGHSGSGKSTLLALLGAMSKASAARNAPQEASHLKLRLDPRGEPIDLAVKLDQKTLQAVRAHLGFVFQMPHLISDCTVRLNLAVLWDPPNGVPPEARIRNICQDLKLITAEKDRSEDRVRRLSGGEQQRVALARALTRVPRVIIADEPTAALDHDLANEILQKLRSWCDEYPEERTVIWATHRTEEAARFADLVIVLRGGCLAPEHEWPKESHGVSAETLRAWINPSCEGPCPGKIARAPAEAISDNSRARRYARTLRVLSQITIAQLFNAPSVDTAASPHWVRRLLLGRSERAASLSVWLSPLIVLGMLGVAVATALGPTVIGWTAFGIGILLLTRSAWRTVVAFGPKLEFIFLVVTLLTVVGIVKAMDLVEIVRTTQLSDPSINPIVLTTRQVEGRGDPLETARTRLIKAGVVPPGRNGAPAKGIYKRYVAPALPHRRTVGAGGQECSKEPLNPTTENGPRTLVADLDEPLFGRLEFAAPKIGSPLEALTFERGVPSLYVLGTAEYERSVIVSEAIAREFLTDKGIITRTSLCVYRSGVEGLTPDTMWAVVTVRAIVKNFPRDTLTSSNEPFGVIYNERSVVQWAPDAHRSLDKGGLPAFAAAYFSVSRADKFVTELDRSLGLSSGSRGALEAEPGYLRLREALRTMGTLLNLLLSFTGIFALLIVIISVQSARNFLAKYRKAITVLQAFGLTRVRLAFMRAQYAAGIMVAVVAVSLITLAMSWPYFREWLGDIGKVSAELLRLSPFEVIGYGLVILILTFICDVGTILWVMSKSDPAAELQEIS